MIEIERAANNVKAEARQIYHFMEIGGPGPLWVQTTDTTTLAEIFRELRNIIPTATLEPYAKRLDKNDGPYFYRLHKLDSKDREVMLWFMKRLGEKSWEPFSVYASPYTAGNVIGGHIYYCFRRVVPSNDFR